MFSSLNVEESSVFDYFGDENIIEVKNELCNAGGTKDFDMIQKKV